MTAVAFQKAGDHLGAAWLHLLALGPFDPALFAADHATAGDGLAGAMGEHVEGADGGQGLIGGPAAQGGQRRAVMEGQIPLADAATAEMDHQQQGAHDAVGVLGRSADGCVPGEDGGVEGGRIGGGDQAQQASPQLPDLGVGGSHHGGHSLGGMDLAEVLLVIVGLRQHEFHPLLEHSPTQHTAYPKCFCISASPLPREPARGVA